MRPKLHCITSDNSKGLEANKCPLRMNAERQLYRSSTLHDSPIKHNEKTTITATHMELVLSILRWEILKKKKAILHVISYRWILKSNQEND